jgi:splicing factor 45
MLTNLDVDHEIQNNDLLQEIGDEMARNGVVERLFIWREEDGGGNEVFVKFVNQVSALRALQACDGMEFADNLVTARFWDREKFERGEYS